MQSTGQASTQAVSLVPIQGSAITYAIGVFSQLPIHNTSGRGNTIHLLPTALRCTKLEFMPAKVRKAVFPAAGLGTRFLPATKAQPKEMLPIVDKPIIQYGVEEAIHSGIQNIIIVTGRGKTAIEDHFDVSFELEYLLEARKKKDLLAIVRNISDVIDVETPCLRRLLDIYSFFSAPVLAVMEMPPESISNYGVIDGEPVTHNGHSDRVYRIRDLVEKPKQNEAPSNLAIIGRYVLTPEIFGSIQAIDPGSGGEIQLTDALRHLLRQRPIYAYRFEGTRYDAGDKLGFLQATVEFALRRHDLGGPFREYLKGLKL